MTSPERLVAFIVADHTGSRSIHYRGIPPELSEAGESRKQLSSAIAVAVEQTNDGIFLYRVALDGEVVGDTWHQSVEEAKQQAHFEFGEALGDWIDAPKEVDLIEFAMKHFARR